MMNKIFLLMLFCSPLLISAQTIEEKKQPEPEKFTYKGSIYKVKNNWLTVGIGQGKNLRKGDPLAAAAFDFHFNIKDKLVKLGFCRTGNVSYLGGSNYFMNDFHAGLGKRRQSFKNNFAWFGGISRVSGIDYNFHTGLFETFKTIGLYADVQAIHKLAYDLGLGFSLYGNYNTVFPVIGFKIEVYFSDAYKGKAR